MMNLLSNDEKVVRWFRHLTRRWGALNVVLAAVLVSVSLSFILVFTFNLLLYGMVTPSALLISSFVPALLAVLTVTSVTNLAAKLDATEIRIKQLIAEDHLTGAHNRQAFLAHAQAEWTRSRRHNYPLSVLLIDVDGLKHINDAHGHLVGDEVLQTVAKACHLCLRGSDFLARYGAEEFMVLLTEADRDGAKVVAERIRVSFKDMPIKHGKQIINASISIGVASQQESTTNLEDLLEQAETSLKLDKVKPRSGQVAPKDLVSSS